MLTSMRATTAVRRSRRPRPTTLEILVAQLLRSTPRIRDIVYLAYYAGHGDSTSNTGSTGRLAVSKDGGKTFPTEYIFMDSNNQQGSFICPDVTSPSADHVIVAANGFTSGNSEVATLRIRQRRRAHRASRNRRNCRCRETRAISDRSLRRATRTPQQFSTTARSRTMAKANHPVFSRTKVARRASRTGRISATAIRPTAARVQAG